jgi:hypothetical protein
MFFLIIFTARRNCPYLKFYFIRKIFTSQFFLLGNITSILAHLTYSLTLTTKLQKISLNPKNLNCSLPLTTQLQKPNSNSKKSRSKIPTKTPNHAPNKTLNNPRQQQAKEDAKQTPDYKRQQTVRGGGIRSSKWLEMEERKRNYTRVA